MKAIRRLGELLDGTTFAHRWQISKWKVKYYLGRWGHIPGFEQLIAQPHRKLLCDAVMRMGPVASVLEIGCGKGPNLYLLNSLLPAATLIGTDPSSAAITRARDELKSRGVAAQLEVESADGLRGRVTASVDIILADAVLFYIPPSNIEHVLAEMVRVARRGIVLGTWHNAGPYGSGGIFYDEGAWIYDYRGLMAGRRDVSVDVVRFPQEVWKDARWRRYGAIVILRHVE